MTTFSDTTRIEAIGKGRALGHPGTTEDSIMNIDAADDWYLKRQPQPLLQQRSRWQTDDGAGHSMDAAPPGAMSHGRGDSIPHWTIDSRELSRKLWHILPGALILGLPLVRQFEPFRSHLAAITVLVTGTFVLLSLIYANR
jgi:hypothetical protein